jgi:hypothetical protein
LPRITAEGDEESTANLIRGEALLSSDRRGVADNPASHRDRQFRGRRMDNLEMAGKVRKVAFIVVNAQKAVDEQW